jgi:hypothetical protein
MSSHATSHVCLALVIVLKHDIDVTDNWTAATIRTNWDVVCYDK